MNVVREALRQRRVARWRRCSKLRDVLTRRIERLECLEAEYGPEPHTTRIITDLKRQRSNVVSTIERLEAKERKRVSA